MVLVVIVVVVSEGKRRIATAAGIARPVRTFLYACLLGSVDLQLLPLPINLFGSLIFFKCELRSGAFFLKEFGQDDGDEGEGLDFGHSAGGDDQTVGTLEGFLQQSRAVGVEEITDKYGGAAFAQLLSSFFVTKNAHSFELILLLEQFLHDQPSGAAPGSRHHHL